VKTDTAGDGNLFTSERTAIGVTESSLDASDVQLRNQHARKEDN
jgi:hypothetical protein